MEAAALGSRATARPDDVLASSSVSRYPLCWFDREGRAGLRFGEHALMASRQDAVDALVARTGLSARDAGSLVSKVLDAVQVEALDLIAGEEPVPSALADARALRLRYISSALGRSLNQREVEAIFRLSPSAAASVIAGMNATYVTLAERLLKEAVKAVLDATNGAGQPLNYTLEGSADAGWRYRILFDERAQGAFTSALFARHGYARHVLRQSGRIVEVDKEIGGTDSIELLNQWLA